MNATVSAKSFVSLNATCELSYFNTVVNAATIVAPWSKLLTLSCMLQLMCTVPQPVRISRMSLIYLARCDEQAYMPIYRLACCVKLSALGIFNTIDSRDLAPFALCILRTHT